jgi:uncharacterized protein YkwD
VALAASGAVKDKPEIAAQIVDLLGDHRRAQGVPWLEHRGALDEAALARARAIAARAPELRLAQEEPIETLLEEVGIRRYHRVREHVELQQGYADAARVAVERWREAPGTWELMMDPRLHALGAATVVGDDGWLVLVVLLLEDLEVPADLGAWEERLLAAVNKIRNEHGLSLQSVSLPLARMARSHSEDMAARGYFAHESPDGEDLSHRVQGRGLKYRRMAENIGRNRGMEDPVAEAVGRWMASNSHRENLLDPGLTETGVGIAVDPAGMFYFTQVFMEPPAGAR